VKHPNGDEMFVGPAAELLLALDEDAGEEPAAGVEAIEADKMKRARGRKKKAVA